MISNVIGWMKIFLISRVECIGSIDFFRFVFPPAKSFSITPSPIFATSALTIRLSAGVNLHRKFRIFLNWVENPIRRYFVDYERYKLWKKKTNRNADSSNDTSVEIFCKVRTNTFLSSA